MIRKGRACGGRWVNSQRPTPNSHVILGRSALRTLGVGGWEFEFFPTLSPARLQNQDRHYRFTYFRSVFGPTSAP